MIQGHVCNFRRRVVRVWFQTACRANSKVANITPGSPTDFEGRPPADGLLAGIVGLSPALGCPLRYTVAHVVGNMEGEGLNIWRD